MSYWICGPRRSGLHAIAEWIAAPFRPNVAIFNDVKPNAPYTQSRRIESPASLQSPVSIAIIEDRPLDEITRHLPDGVTCVLLLRNPWNLLASRLEYARRRMVAKSMMDLKRGLRRWREIASAALDEAHEGDGGTGGRGEAPAEPRTWYLVYDRWFADAGYRHQLAAELGIPPDTPPPAKVSPIGHGSSFDGLRFDGRAHQMQVLDRPHTDEVDRAITPGMAAKWELLYDAR